MKLFAKIRLIIAAPALLQQTLDLLENVECSTGVCCCGARMADHGPYDNHSPVDRGDWHQSQIIEKLRTALGVTP